MLMLREIKEALEVLDKLLKNAELKGEKRIYIVCYDGKIKKVRVARQSLEYF